MSKLDPCVLTDLEQDGVDEKRVNHWFSTLAEL